MYDKRIHIAKIVQYSLLIPQFFIIFCNYHIIYIYTYHTDLYIFAVYVNRNYLGKI